MKKIALLFCLAILLSCSSDDSSQPHDTTADVLLKKTITQSNGNSYETLFTYDGKKLLQARSVKENKKFNYSGNNISKISWYTNPDTDNTLSQTVEFEYLPDGKLKKFKQESDNPLTVEFTYVGQDTVNFVARAYRSSYDFVGYFTVRDNEISEYVYLNGGRPRPSVKYTYDSKNHPLKNVTGYNKLFLYHYFYNSAHFNGFTTNVGSSKNCISNSLIQDPSVIEVMNTYEYNENGFPKVINKDSNSAADYLFY
ncbi:hypothetical protein [Flavobacterium microcysteis]|uniref:DUF4595 domain-containing protein n=1 Tax=Flavobacterium microcysteis TaxID=2596891 RepID=A0A501Q2V4_9FLAO|nr:hypothetical protein [Flavobacterium microcysteis]TPD67013.1 hypothetical protein FJA49_12080 [Flavobacterium microcysteis]